MMDDRAQCFGKARRVVVKVGSNVLTASQGLNVEVLHAISREIHELMAAGLEVILVSSGAMAAGMRRLQLPKRPVEIPQRQAVAAVGQAGLIMEYEKVFETFGTYRNVAQVLLTQEDLANRKRFLNARNTLNTLIAWKVLPIINENDTVAVEEIKFGDNDNLSAMITLLMDADLLINLTDMDGLFTKDPRTTDDAELIPEVQRITRKIEALAGDIPGALGTGGMGSKLRAAKKTMMAGIPMIIARGTRPYVLRDLFRGENLGTFFVPGAGRLRSRKCWIAFNLKPKGALLLDGGASSAVLCHGKSLLPGGIARVDGEFSMGDPVNIVGSDGSMIGVGLCNYASVDIRRIMGKKTVQIREILGYKPYDEVVHRDNLAITAEAETF
ncbi:glutamate 5-kinase [Desulfobotulus sp. H1]|uniref:Glutamate 5-kinase n=1 Tax=Desulfobotulus pelophilus TaxID=2823377 RepID=A0ABT3NCF2_9BACT|nr:glutamate 5-kinase [Desulfobotulus pelophilus]MCW7755155.1 glutamate 5-kinase [Desulfobotulus pelophilus]